MAEILLKIGKHHRLDPIDNVRIVWSDAINLRKLKQLLLEDKNTLSSNEQAIWNKVKDKEDWLYCFVGHLDDSLSIREFYPEEKRENIAMRCQIYRSLYSKEILNGNDVGLDFGKVDDQNIMTRIKQHFEKGDYLEMYRRDAEIRFPLSITPSEVDFMGDYIDTLETILINGHNESSPYRFGICNEKKKDNPQLFYPIKSIENIATELAMEKKIKVNIE